MAAKNNKANLSVPGAVVLSSALKAGGIDNSASSIPSVVEFQGRSKPSNGEDYYLLYGIPAIQPGSLANRGPIPHLVDNQKHTEPEEHVHYQNKRSVGEKKKNKAKESKKRQQTPRVLMTTSGATFGTVSGGTINANTTTVGGNSYVQHGPKAQQRWYHKGEKSDSESDDDSSDTGDSSD